ASLRSGFGRVLLGHELPREEPCHECTLPLADLHHLRTQQVAVCGTDVIEESTLRIRRPGMAIARDHGVAASHGEPSYFAGPSPGPASLSTRSERPLTMARVAPRPLACRRPNRSGTPCPHPSRQRCARQSWSRRPWPVRADVPHRSARWSV